MVSRETVISHHFYYGKRAEIPAGTMLRQHSHKYDHHSLLLSGRVLVSVDGDTVVYKAPALLTIKAHKKHAVHALADSVWVCLHETDERDVAKIDAEAIE